MTVEIRPLVAPKTGVQFLGRTDKGDQYLVTEASRAHFTHNARDLGLVVLVSSPCTLGYYMTLGKSTIPVMPSTGTPREFQVNKTNPWAKS